MKVAFASITGELVDQHFGWATEFYVYDVTALGVAPADIRLVPAPASDEADRIEARLNAIADCAMLYVANIGGTAAAKVIKHRIHPVKVTDSPTVAAILDQLVELLRGTPPPWMRKLIDPSPALLDV
jgi:nitrogen fixation protein NifX